MTPIEKARTAGFLFLTLYTIYKSIYEDDVRESGEWEDLGKEEMAVFMALRWMRNNVGVDLASSSKRPRYAGGSKW